MKGLVKILYVESQSFYNVAQTLAKFLRERNYEVSIGKLGIGFNVTDFRSLVPFDAIIYIFLRIF